MNDDKNQSKSIYKVIINAPIDKIWSELIRVNSPRPFFFGGVCNTPDNILQLGTPFRMDSPNGKYASVVGKVIEFDPPYRYSHSFKFTSYDDPPCKVTYILKEVEGGVEFTLISENFVIGSKTQGSMESGGKFIVDNLKSLVENGKPTFGGRVILTIIALMTPFTPSKCQIEHWPFDACE